MYIRVPASKPTRSQKSPIQEDVWKTDFWINMCTYYDVRSLMGLCESLPHVPHKERQSGCEWYGYRGYWWSICIVELYAVLRLYILVGMYTLTKPADAFSPLVGARSPRCRNNTFPRLETKKLKSYCFQLPFFDDNSPIFNPFLRQAFIKNHLRLRSVA